MMHVLVTLRALVPAQLGCCHVFVHFGNLALWDHSCAREQPEPCVSVTSWT